MTAISEPKLLTDYSWARKLLVERFRTNIEQYLTAESVTNRVRYKARLGDDLYEAILSTIDRHQYLSMMTLWSVGQGIGVRVRRWVEEAVKDLIIYQKQHFGREIEQVYTSSDLRQRRFVPEIDLVALAGEDQDEHCHRKYWSVPVRVSIVRVAESLSDEVNRSYARRGGGWEATLKETQARGWERLPVSLSEPLRDYPIETTAFQEAWLREVALNPRYEPASLEKITCNLLVLEKPPGRIRAFRFASPRLSSLRAIRDEKRNLLVLYGWLRQEKPFRVYQDSVRVSWTELMHRPIPPTQEFFFGNQVLGSERFWEYLGVPYDILLESLKIAGQALADQIQGAVHAASAESIRKLNPDGPYHRSR